MRILLLALFTLFKFSLLAQHQLTFKTDPFRPLTEQNKYVLPLGVEYSIGKFGVQLEQVVMVSRETDLYRRSNLNYSKTNLQIRYYVEGLFHGSSLGFVGLHGTVRNYDFHETSGSYISKEGRNINYQNSRVETQNYGAYLISGVRHSWKNNFTLEFVMGFGVREVSVEQNAEEVTFVEYLDPIFFEELDPEWREGARTIPGILMQLRFGYVLFGNKKKG